MVSPGFGSVVPTAEKLQVRATHEHVVDRGRRDVPGRLDDRQDLLSGRRRPELVHGCQGDGRLTNRGERATGTGPARCHRNPSARCTPRRRSASARSRPVDDLASNVHTFDAHVYVNAATGGRLPRGEVTLTVRVTGGSVAKPFWSTPRTIST